MKSIFLGISFFLVSIFIFSSEEIQNLDQAIQLAMKNSDVILIREYQESITRDKNRSQLGSFKPQLQIQSSAEYTNSSIQSIFENQLGEGIENVPKSEESFYLLNAEIRQYLFGFGNYLNTQKIIHEVQNQEIISTQKALSELIFRIQKKWIDFHLAEANFQISKKRQEQRLHEYQEVESRKIAGNASDIDLREAKIFYQQSQQNMLQKKYEKHLHLLELKKLLGLFHEEVNIQSSLISEPIILEDQWLEMRSLIDQNLSLKMIDSSKHQAKYQRQQKFKELLPQSFLFANSSSYGNEDDLPDSIQDPYWSLGIKFSWNLWQGGRVYHEANAFDTLYKMLNIEYDKLKNELTIDFEILSEQFITFKKQLKIQMQSIELSEKNYVDAEVLYHEGILTWNQYQDASLRYEENLFLKNQILSQMWKIYFQINELVQYQL